MELTIVLPVHNAQTTIIQTLDSLLSQSIKFNELIIVDDASNDNSLTLIKKYIYTSKINFKLICHDVSLGLAESYNHAIKQAKSSYIVTVHQDVIFPSDALFKLILPFNQKSQPPIVASYHRVYFPFAQWRQYNFWGKVMFASKVGRQFSGLDGKFDCFEKKALIKVNLFDSLHFKRSGEDSDMVYKLKQIGRVVSSKASILHIHNLSSCYSLNDVFHKFAQQAQTQGVLLRNHRITNWGQFVKTFHRELMVLFLIIPHVRWLSLIFIGIYIIRYSWPIYFEKKINPKILILPFINVCILFISTIFTIQGFVTNRQNI